MGISGNWNYYEILDVPPYGTLADIQKAYQKAKSTYSLTNPEIFKIFSEDEALAWLKLVEEAYKVLGHPRSREIYNQELLGKGRLAPTELNFVPEEPAKQFLQEDEPEIAKEEEQTLESHQGETSLSIYDIDPKMEELISSQNVYDGLFLKKIRMYKNVDLQDFSQKTCIALRHLYAIENNNFAVLPAAVFVRGYIIQYCKFLNLEQTKVVPSFMSLLANESHPNL